MSKKVNVFGASRRVVNSDTLSRYSNCLLISEKSIQQQENELTDQSEELRKKDESFQQINFLEFQFNSPQEQYSFK